MQGQLNPDLLKRIETVYYHGNCPDGIISREVLKLVLPKETIYIPYYFESLDNIPYNALFIDCSPKPDQLEFCLNNYCLIAEHHDTFKPLFNEYMTRFDDQMVLGNNEFSESGARLALMIANQLNPKVIHQDLIDFVSLVAISDTWKVQNADFGKAREYAAYITFFGNDFNIPLNKFYYDYEAVKRYADVQTRNSIELADTAMFRTERGMKIAFINSLLISDAAEILRETKNVDIIVGYLTKAERTQFSLRSKTNGFDVGAFAKRQNGGGHKAAAGFEITCYDERHPIVIFRALINANTQ